MVGKGGLGREMVLKCVHSLSKGKESDLPPAASLCVVVSCRCIENLC